MSYISLDCYFHVAIKYILIIVIKEMFKKTWYNNYIKQYSCF